MKTAIGILTILFGFGFLLASVLVAIVNFNFLEFLQVFGYSIIGAFVFGLFGYLWSQNEKKGGV